MRALFFLSGMLNNLVLGLFLLWPCLGTSYQRSLALQQFRYLLPIALFTMGYAVFRHVMFKRRRAAVGITDHDPDAHAPPIFWICALSVSLAAGLVFSIAFIRA